MSRRQTGFEAAAAVDFYSKGADSTYETSPVAHTDGRYSLRSTATDSAKALGVRMIGYDAATEDMVCRFYYYPRAHPTTVTDELYPGTWYVLSAIEATTLMPVVIHCNDGKVGIIAAGGGAGSLTKGTTTLSLETWYCIEWRINGTSTHVDLRINEASPEIDYADVGLASFGWITVGGWAATTSGDTDGDGNFDDVLTEDSISWLGEGQGRIFAPIEDGYYPDWVAVPAGDDYPALDDDLASTPPAPDDTDYIKTSAVDEKASVKPADAATLGIDGTINAIQPIVRGGYSDGGNSGGYKTLARINDSDTVSSGVLFYLSPEWFSKSLPVVLIGPFYRADWNTVEAGCQKGNNAYEARVQTVWFGVDWTPATPGTGQAGVSAIKGNKAIQPNETDGKDAYMDDSALTSNFNNDYLYIGTLAVGKVTKKYRSIVEYDISSLAAIPSQAQLCIMLSVTSARTNLYVDSTKMLRGPEGEVGKWIEGQMTQTVYRTGSNWTTAGCSGEDSDKDSDVETSTLIPDESVAPAESFVQMDVKELVDDAYPGDEVSMRLIGNPETTAAGVILAYSSAIAIERKRPILVMQVEVVGGVLYYQAVAGALASAGILTSKPTKALTSIFISSGILSSKPIKTLSGALTLSGVLVRKTLTSLTGVVSFAGVLTSKPIKLLTGVLTSSGILTRKIIISLTGALTSSGILVRKTAISLAGDIGTTGTLVGSLVTGLVKKSLYGTLTLSGVVTRKTSFPLSGILTFSGVVVRKTSISLSGALTYIGTLVRQISISLEGVLTLSGTIVVFPKKVLSGVLAFTGTISYLSKVILAGTLAFTGTLRRTLPVLIAVSLTLYSGILTNIQKGAILSLTTLSGVRDLVVMVLIYSLKKLSGTTSVSKADHPISLDLILYSGQQDLKKETEE